MSELKSKLCPSCETPIDSHTLVSGKDDGNRKPKPGEHCICLNCSELLAFTEEMTLRIITAKEFVCFCVHKQVFLAVAIDIAIEVKKKMKAAQK